jgi:hypothetical protein
VKFEDQKLKVIAVIALIAIAISNGIIALWLAQIVDLLMVIANK